VPFKGMHRYLPALLGAAGLRLGELPVAHRPRRAGVSKYTIAGRAWVGIQDLIGVGWLLRRRVPWPVGLPR
jgi:dolichol-phosphate mannosyltransferase